jgi:hypothetical protein
MVQDYFSSLPLTDINMSLRRNFLMFLHGCNLHDLHMLPHAAAVIGLRSVIKCMRMPYFDRAVMEFIHFDKSGDDEVVDGDSDGLGYNDDDDDDEDDDDDDESETTESK